MVGSSESSQLYEAIAVQSEMKDDFSNISALLKRSFMSSSHTTGPKGGSCSVFAIFGCQRLGPLGKGRPSRFLYDISHNNMKIDIMPRTGRSQIGREVRVA